MNEQEQRFAEAAREYVEAASYLEYLGEEEGEEEGDAMDVGGEGSGVGVAAEAKALEVTLQCNAALCYLKAQAWAEAVQHAAAALKKEPVGGCGCVCASFNARGNACVSHLLAASVVAGQRQGAVPPGGGAVAPGAAGGGQGGFGGGGQGGAQQQGRAAGAPSALRDVTRVVWCGGVVWRWTGWGGCVVGCVVL